MFKDDFLSSLLDSAQADRYLRETLGSNNIKIIDLKEVSLNVNKS